ncbi:MAG TPA: hypothetical protein VJS89_09835 [Gammaproteobacteria bacterium]|nr:hypothetical protein [Gammaproteobacteria bacterium]
MTWLVPLLALLVTLPCHANQLSAQDQAAIYNLVVLRLIGPDDTYNGQLHPKKIYISEMLFVPPPAKQILHFYDLLESGPPPPPPDIDVRGAPVHIPSDVKRALTNKYSSEQRQVSWVKDENSAPISSDECGNEGSPLLIAFSTLQELPDGGVFVQGTLQCGPLWGATYYELAKNAHGWHITRVMHGPMS